MRYSLVLFFYTNCHSRMKNLNLQIQAENPEHAYFHFITKIRSSRIVFSLNLLDQVMVEAGALLTVFTTVTGDFARRNALLLLHVMLLH